MTENSATPRRCQHLLEDSTGGRGFSKQTLIKDLAKTFGPALWRFEVVVPMTIFSLTNCHDYYHCYYFYGDCCYVYLLYSYERHPYYYYYYYYDYYYYFLHRRAESFLPNEPVSVNIWCLAVVTTTTPAQTRPPPKKYPASKEKPFQNAHRRAESFLPNQPQEQKLSDVQLCR